MLLFDAHELQLASIVQSDATVRYHWTTGKTCPVLHKPHDINLYDVDQHPKLGLWMIHPASYLARRYFKQSSTAT